HTLDAIEIGETRFVAVPEALRPDRLTVGADGQARDVRFGTVVRRLIHRVQARLPDPVDRLPARDVDVVAAAGRDVVEIFGIPLPQFVHIQFRHRLVLIDPDQSRLVGVTITSLVFGEQIDSAVTGRKIDDAAVEADLRRLNRLAVTAATGD